VLIISVRMCCIVLMLVVEQVLLLFIPCSLVACSPIGASLVQVKSVHFQRSLVKQTMQIDIDEISLQFARINVRNNHLSDRIKIRRSKTGSIILLPLKLYPDEQ
jgi:hypothetical protein